jgi:hypothetical protein
MIFNKRQQRQRRKPSIRVFVCLRDLRYLLLNIGFLSFLVARRVGRPVWGITACALVASFAFTFRTGVVPPTFKQNLIVWFGFATGREQLQIALLQSAVPLILGLWAWRRTARHVAGEINEPGLTTR